MVFLWQAGLILCVLVASCRGGVLTADNLPHNQTMADGYDLYWDFNKTHIMFQAHVKTNGYIGLGISAHGGMYPSDVIIAWVKDGQVHFADRHAIGLFMPVLDTSQDWYLVEGKEEGDYTTVTMVRALDTCDTDDRPITSAGTRVIYSYSHDDPESDDSISYHGNTRGNKLLHLLRSEKVSKPNPLPDDVFTVDFIKHNYTIPSSENTNSCSLLKLPPLKGKHHLIRYEPVVQPLDSLVHHLVLYACTNPMDDSALGKDVNCKGGNPQFSACKDKYLTWIVGGPAFDYPNHVGHSLGSLDDPVYFMLEIHYNNPHRKAGQVDNSGFRLFLTNHLRPFDAGLLPVGVTLGPYLFIPPYYDDFLYRGYCDAACIAKATGDDVDIHMFATLPHAHQAGRGISFRHIRNGTELPPLVEDLDFDSNFQEMKKLPEERTVKKGDSLIVECHYDTTKRTGLTWGGQGAGDEMCVIFVLYYPKKSIFACSSRVDFRNLEQKSGRNIFEIIFGMNFKKKEVRNRFQDYVNEAPIYHVCTTDRERRYPGEIPTVTTPYQPVDQCNP